MKAACAMSKSKALWGMTVGAGFSTVLTVTPGIQSWWLAGPAWLLTGYAAWRWLREPQSDPTRANLGVSFWPKRPPYRFEEGGTRAVRFRLGITNAGPVAADNVQLSLRNISPRPRNAGFPADYPYLAVPIPEMIGERARRINDGDEQLFEVFPFWYNAERMFLLVA
jgi:hypothetical protein